jgi:hypothetical protein
MFHLFQVIPDVIFPSGLGPGFHLYIFSTILVSVRHSIYLSKPANINFQNPCVHSFNFGSAEVACWPLIPKFSGSNPAEAVGFLKGDKNPQHAFLRKGSKIIGSMSQICGM